MPSVFSPSLKIEEIASGEASGTWGVRTNNNLGNLIEQAIAYTTSVNVTSADITLTSLNGVMDQARSAVIEVTGTPGVTRVVTVPNVQKTYTIRNRTANIAQIKTASGTAFNCPALSDSYLVCDGANGVVGRSITDGANAITSLATPFTSPAFLGTPTAPTAVLGTSTTQLATTAFASAAAAAAFPVGGIIMWSGSIASIPSGWLLCNGASGTPDLRDRFIVGAGTTYVPGATGGANTNTLSIANLPAHTHTGSGTTANNNVSHNHGFSATTGDNNVGHTHTGSGTTSAQDTNHVHSGTTGDNSVGHTHGFSASGTSGAAGGHSHSVNDPSHAHTNGRIPTGSASGNNPNLGAVGGNTGNSFTGISINGVANHSHSIALSGTTGGISANHNHAITTGANSANHAHTYSFTTSNVSANHVHAVSGTTATQSADHAHTYSFTTSSVGSGTAVENRPLYYALAYIIRS